MLTSESRAMVATNATFMVLAILSVVLRFQIRRPTAFCLELDDYMILTALFFSIALAVTNIVGVFAAGFGAPFESLSDEKGIAFLKVLFVLQFWYILAVAFVKFSILCFYGRLFSVRRFPVAVNIMIVLTGAWLVSFLFATFFQVWPLWCNWIVCAPTTNYPVMYVCSSVTDIVLDVSILCLPISFIRKLHMSSVQKIGTSSIFGLGIFCIVSSAARLVYTVRFMEGNIELNYDVGNYAVNFDAPVVNMIMWSSIEACASVICASLPFYAPLLRKGFSLGPFFTSLRSAFSLPRKEDRSRSVSSKRSMQKETSSPGKNNPGTHCHRIPHLGRHQGRR